MVVRVEPKVVPRELEGPDPRHVQRLARRTLLSRYQECPLRRLVRTMRGSTVGAANGGREGVLDALGGSHSLYVTSGGVGASLPHGPGAPCTHRRASSSPMRRRSASARATSE